MKSIFYKKIIFLFAFVIFLFQFAPLSLLAAGGIGIPCGRNEASINEELAAGKITVEKGEPFKTAEEKAESLKKMCTFEDVFILINKFIKGILEFVIAPFVLILVIYAGFLYLTSGGAAEKREKAKNIFYDIVIGILWILGSWLIVYTLFKSLGYTGETGLEGFK